MRLTLLLLICLLLSGCGIATADEIDDLIPCIVEIESAWNPVAVSPQGCVGLAQINPYGGAMAEFNHYANVGTFNGIDEYKGLSWEPKSLKTNYTAQGTTIEMDKIVELEHRRLYLPVTREDLFEEDVNLFICEWYLRRLKNHYLKDHYTIERLLAAYNGGITRLRKADYNTNRMPSETRRYIKKVMRLYEKTKEKKPIRD